MVMVSKNLNMIKVELQILRKIQKMSNELQVKIATRKAKLDSDVKLFEQSIVLVPYLASGYIDYTNKGAVSTQQIIYVDETFNRV